MDHRFSTTIRQCLSRGQNRYAQPTAESTIKRYGQKSNTRCSGCLRMTRLEVSSVSTPATRIGTQCKQSPHPLQDPNSR